MKTSQGSARLCSSTSSRVSLALGICLVTWARDTTRIAEAGELESADER